MYARAIPSSPYLGTAEDRNPASLWYMRPCRTEHHQLYEHTRNLPLGVVNGFWNGSTGLGGSQGISRWSMLALKL